MTVRNEDRQTELFGLLPFSQIMIILISIIFKLNDRIFQFMEL